MSWTVWKFELQPGMMTVLDMPRDARALTVGAQGEGVFLWALVDPHAELERRRFLTAGTGHLWPREDFGPHVGTAFLGGLVFHVFESEL